MLDKLSWNVQWEIDKYRTYQDFLNREKYDSVIVKENLLLNGGIEALLKLLIGSAETNYSNSNARIGVGDSSTTESASQTGLVGQNKSYQDMDSGYPAIDGQTVTFQATFGGAEANHPWQEFVIDNGTTALNRKVSDQGTKIAGQTWTIKVSITIS